MSRLSRIFKPGSSRLRKPATEPLQEDDALQLQFPLEVLDQIFHNLADETPEIILGLMLISHFFYKRCACSFDEYQLCLW